MGHYDFKTDLEEAHGIEERLVVFLDKKYPSFDFHGFSNNKAYDCHFTLEGIYYKLEIKSDYYTNTTGNIVLEYESRGKISGITTTQADLIAYCVVTPTGLDIYMFNTKKLKKLIKDEVYERKLIGGDPGSATKMYLFKLDNVKQYSTFMKENYAL